MVELLDWELDFIDFADEDHWSQGRSSGYFEDTHLALSERESYLWIVISKEQKLALRSRPRRKALKALNEQFLFHLEQNIERFEFQTPKISFVLRERKNNLFRWVRSRALLLI